MCISIHNISLYNQLPGTQAKVTTLMTYYEAMKCKNNCGSWLWFHLVIIDLYLPWSPFHYSMLNNPKYIYVLQTLNESMQQIVFGFFWLPLLLFFCCSWVVLWGFGVCLMWGVIGGVFYSWHLVGCNSSVLNELCITTRRYLHAKSKSNPIISLLSNISSALNLPHILAQTPSNASISRTRWPLPMPPKDGLHDISPANKVRIYQWINSLHCM